MNAKSADTSAVGKFTTAWSRTNYLSHFCLRSCLDEWLHLYIHLFTCVEYIYNYTHTHTHTHTPGYACMSLWIKHGFPDLPFQDGHKLVVCTDSVICSVTNGVFTADSVCAHLLHCLLLGTTFLNAFPQKAHKLGICNPLWHKQAIVKRRRIRLTSKYCNMHKIMCSFC